MVTSHIHNANDKKIIVVTEKFSDTAKLINRIVIPVDHKVRQAPIVNPRARGG